MLIAFLVRLVNFLDSRFHVLQETTCKVLLKLSTELGVIVDHLDHSIEAYIEASNNTLAYFPAILADILLYLLLPLLLLLPGILHLDHPIVCGDVGQAGQTALVRVVGCRGSVSG